MKRRYRLSGRVTVGVSVDVMIEDSELAEYENAVEWMGENDPTSLVETVGDSRGTHLTIDGGTGDSVRFWTDGCYIEFDDAEPVDP